MPSEASTINKELTSLAIPLENLFLDPNNPRFTSIYWETIPENRIDKGDTQKMVQNKLEELFAIDRLIMNIEANGYLPIDRIVVKEFKENKYLVLEGNRRVCAAKILKEKSESHPDSVDADVIESLLVIDCLVYTGSEDQPAWIFQGLRHIMGIHEWSAFNKAKLLVQLMENEGFNLTEVGKKFGLTAYGAGQWVRGYFAFKRALEESDYTREVDEIAYPYFQEIFSRSNTAFREWLKWNDTDYRFDDELHFNEFLSWLYPRDEQDAIDGTNVRGDWSQRLLQARLDIRTLSYLIRESPAEFEGFRFDGDIDKAYSIATTKKLYSQSNPSEDAFNNIETCIKSLENLPFKIIRADRERLNDLLVKLEKAIGEIKDACQ